MPSDQQSLEELINKTKERYTKELNNNVETSLGFKQPFIANLVTKYDSAEILFANAMIYSKVLDLLNGRNDADKSFVTDQAAVDFDGLIYPSFSPYTPHPTNLKKETTMKVSDAQILVQLAQADVNDEFTENMQSMPAALREAIEDQRKQESKEAMQKAAKLILQVYKDSEEAVRTQVQNIRNARIMEQQSKERIEKIKRAKAYAEATNNYLPLASLVGGLDVGVSVDKSKLSIPEDWVAPEEKEANPAPTKKVVAKK